MSKHPIPLAPGSALLARYDAWNRLVSLDAAAHVFRYDGLHRRVERSEDGVAIHFYYNEQWQCLEERAAESGPTSKQFVRGPTYVDELICRDRDADGNAANGPEQRHFYLQDALYNVTALLDSAGTVVERYHYDPYGKPTILDADFSLDADGLSDIDNEHLYTGRRTDPGTGLQINRNRYYHQQLGRWVSRDPIGYSGSPGSLYLHAPLELDPSGLSSFKCPPGWTLHSSAGDEGIIMSTPWKFGGNETHFFNSRFFLYERVKRIGSGKEGMCDEGLSVTVNVTYGKEKTITLGFGGEFGNDKGKISGHASLSGSVSIGVGIGATYNVPRVPKHIVAVYPVGILLQEYWHVKRGPRRLGGPVFESFVKQEEVWDRSGVAVCKKKCCD